MLEIAAWSVVAGSFVLIGLCGYASIGQNPSGSSSKGGRLILAILAAIVSAFVLHFVAGAMFSTVEITSFKRLGSIQEDQMQPDMPNLMAGLLMFGWIFFFAGFLVARSWKHSPNNRKSEHDSGLNGLQP
jgi:drug/metabolite transporter (DMT)-like permease